MPYKELWQGNRFHELSYFFDEYNEYSEGGGGGGEGGVKRLGTCAMDCIRTEAVHC